MASINDYQLLSLFVGGEDGTKRQDGSSAFTGECHMIKVLVDGTGFSVLGGKDQDDTTVNFLTANNLTSKTWNAGDLVLAPFGGYFASFTADQEVEYYKMPGTNRTRQEV